MSSDSKLSPTDTLRCLRALHSDPLIEPAQRSAVAWIILCADNKTGCAWASYENIHKNTGLAPATIREALRRAEGKYLRRAGLGRKGAIRWRVALQPLKCTSTIEVQPEAPALQPLPPCTSTTEDILTLYTSPLQKTRGERAATAATPSPSAGVQPPEMADGKKTAKSPHTQLVAYWCAQWKETHDAAYPFTRRDAVHVKQVLDTAGGDLARAKGIIDAYLVCGDKWYIERGHKLGLLIGDLPRFIAGGTAGPVRSAGGLEYARHGEALPRVGKPADAAG